MISFLPFLYVLVIPDYERMAPIYFLDLYLLIIQLCSLYFCLCFLCLFACVLLSFLLWRLVGGWSKLPGNWATRGYLYL